VIIGLYIPAIQFDCPVLKCVQDIVTQKTMKTVGVTSKNSCHPVNIMNITGSKSIT
jgi:hypothetical protein